MIIDAQFKFATTQQVLSGTSAVASTNVHDAGAAKLVFGGFSQRPPDLVFLAEWNSDGGSPTIRAQFVGASAAALNAGIVVIADTGIITVADDGTAFAAGHIYARRIMQLVGQLTACRYYGVLFTQGGTTPVFHVQAFIVADGQSNLPAEKAAVP